MNYNLSKRFRSSAFAVLSMIVMMLPAFLAWAQEAHDISQRDQPRFGVVEAYYRPDDARDLNVGWDRIIFEWAKFQPNSPHEFNLDVIPEAWLLEAQTAGREVVGLLKNTPLWASGTQKLGAPPNGLELSIDDPNNYWAAFVKRVVWYYGDRWDIHHWIIYNEPDLRPGELPFYEFDGNVEDYYQMLKVAYLAAKSVNSEAVIHMAGMAWWNDVAAFRMPYLKRLLTVASNDTEAYQHGFFFDVVMVHTYYGTQNVWHVTRAIRDIVWSYGLRDKELWIDETNASPSRDLYAELPTGAQFDVSLAQQADFIVQAAALSLAAGVERFAVYRLYDNHYTPGLTEPWGLVRGDGSRRPAFRAYQTVIQTFGETTRARWWYSDRSSLVTLEQADRTVYVMWARSTEPVTFHVLANNQENGATRLSVYGATWPVKPNFVSGAEEWKWWYVLDAPGALANDAGLVMVEGSPVLVIIEGPPRSVWIEVAGVYWTLR